MSVDPSMLASKQFLPRVAASAGFGAVTGQGRVCVCTTTRTGADCSPRWLVLQQLLGISVQLIPGLKYLEMHFNHYCSLCIPR